MAADAQRMNPSGRTDQQQRALVAHGALVDWFRSQLDLETSVQ